MLENILDKLEKEMFGAKVYNDDFDGTYIGNLLCLGNVRAVLEDYMNDDWITTKKRLPEKEGVYDVTVINGKGESVVCTWQFLAGIHLSGRQTYVDGVHYWASNYSGDPINEYLSQNVVAWRERPEPYRPERKEK